jgi:hypothetical protein
MPQQLWLDHRVGSRERSMTAPTTGRAGSTKHVEALHALRLLVPAVLAVGFTVTAAQAQPMLLEVSPRRIHVKEGKHLLRPCSRFAPAADGAFWQPTAEQIGTLQAALPAYVQTRRDSGLRVPPATVSYRGQYIGFTRAGVPLIYGDFQSAAGYPDWAPEGKAITVCDGGPRNWGVVFDPVTRRFDEIEFNGR